MIGPHSPSKAISAGAFSENYHIVRYETSILDDRVRAALKKGVDRVSLQYFTQF